jgi:DNA-binding winged helix-turn-helix (wHTH) protein
LSEFYNGSFFYRGLKTSDRLMANVHPVMARLRPAGQRCFNGATMIQMRQILFPPFRLDPINERLMRDQEVIPLRPKSFAVLRYLAERPDELVRKEELIEAVWPRTYVTDTLLKVCVTEIRKALGDDPAAPRFIETVHCRGYRFIAPVAPNPEECGALRRVTHPGGFGAPLRLRLSPGPVGCEAGFAQLERLLERAMKGERQVVFIIDSKANCCWIADCGLQIAD